MSERTSQPLAWADFGSCTNADPDLFFPQPGADTSYARSICRGCPVRIQCLDYALLSGQKHGIWGGMTESQRRRLRRRSHPSNPVEQRVEPADVVEPVESAEPVTSPVRHLQLVR
jgi:WhiB family redox-sensing transcriptional regulator